MQWNRGWLRLWIFLSLVWGVGVIAQCMFSWPMKYESVRLMDHDLGLLSADTKNLFIKPGPEPQTGRWVQTLVFESVPIKSKVHPDRIERWGSPNSYYKNIWDTSPIEPSSTQVEMKSGQIFYFWFSSSTPDAIQHARITTAKTDYERVQQLLLHRMQWSHAGSYLLFWVAPCVALLVFAIGLRWVIFGFRPNAH